jgi:hypothetical protein
MKILKIVDGLTNGIHRKNPQRRYIESRKRICESGMNKITIWKSNVCVESSQFAALVSRRVLAK